MIETVSVEEAIAKGRRMINYPVSWIICGMSIISMLLNTFHIFPAWIIIVGVVGGFITAWVYWSFMITKWRIWAFENVRNVHELKKRAVQVKLIWPEDNFFEKTEIRTANHKEKLRQLEEKFYQEDIFIEDFNIPNETRIYYSKKKKYTEVAVLVCCLVVGIYLIVDSKSPILGVIMAVICLYFGFKEYRKAMNTEAQIIINNRGIQTASAPFYEWDEIWDEELLIEGVGRDPHFYLIYSNPDGREKIEIDGLAITGEELHKLLITYRGRNSNNRHY